MFLALRELRRSWRRFGLVGAVVALVAVLSTLVVGLSDGLVEQGISGLRSMPLDHLAFEPHSDATFTRSTVDRSQLTAWEKHAEATPVGMSFINATAVGAPASSIDLALFGVRPRSFLVQRDGIPAALSRPAGLVLSREFQEKGVHVGDRFEMGGSGVVLRVAGFAGAGSYGHAGLGVTSLATWRRVAYGGGPGGRFSAIALRIPSGTDLAAVDRLAGTETMTKEAAYSGSPGYVAETQTMTMIQVFLLVISALIVGAFFTVLTLQRVRQIGVLKAMGASSWYVVRDGLAQIAIVVVFATAVGAAIGGALIAAMSGGSVPVIFSVGSVVIAAVVLAASGIVGGAVTLRRASRVEPSVALGIEG